jgi:hypothetical protein
MRGKSHDANGWQRVNANKLLSIPYFGAGPLLLFNFACRAPPHLGTAPYTGRWQGATNQQARSAKVSDAARKHDCYYRGKRGSLQKVRNERGFRGKVFGKTREASASKVVQMARARVLPARISQKWPFKIAKIIVKGDG